MRRGHKPHRGGHHSHKRIGFKGLAREVEHEYESKGYSRERSKRIGRATAAKVYKEQMHKRRGF